MTAGHGLWSVLPVHMGIGLTIDVISLIKLLGQQNKM